MGQASHLLNLLQLSKKLGILLKDWEYVSVKHLLSN